MLASSPASVLCAKACWHGDMIVVACVVVVDGAARNMLFANRYMTEVPARSVGANSGNLNQDSSRSRTSRHVEGLHVARFARLSETAGRWSALQP